VVDTNGCITNHPFTITSGTYIANLTYNPTVICKDEQITFTNTSNETVTTYNWSFGDGGTSNLPSSTHTYITAGDLPVTLSITNSEDGCFDDTTVTITVIDLIKANFTSSGSYCEGDSILFTDLSNMNPVTWEWSMGNGATGDVPIFYYIYPFAGSYIVSLTATDQQCGIDTYIDTIVINYIPYISIGVDTFICPGQSMFFNAQNNGDSYLWYNGATTQTISPTFSGNTDISVVVNHLGCLAGDTISVLVDCSINMPNAFSPDANGKNDLFRPRGRNVLSYEMLVYNRWGNQVYSGKGGPDLAVGWDGKISGEEAEVGTYSYYLKGVLRDNSTIEKQGNITLIR
jgi:gliding motility-associated-like protein